MGKSKQSAGAVLCDQVQDVASTVGPAVNEARANARAGLVNDVIPAVRDTLEDVREQLDEVRDQAVPIAEEARKRSLEAAAALRGERPRRGPKIALGLGILAVAAGAAFAAKKMMAGGGPSTPTGSSRPTPSPASGTAPGAPSYSWGTAAASDDAAPTTTASATTPPTTPPQARTDEVEGQRDDVLRPDERPEGDDDLMSPGGRTDGDAGDVLGPEGFTKP